MRCAPHRCRMAFRSICVHWCLVNLQQFHKQLTCQIRLSLTTKTLQICCLCYSPDQRIRLGRIAVHNSTPLCLGESWHTMVTMSHGSTYPSTKCLPYSIPAILFCVWISTRSHDWRTIKFPSCNYTLSVCRSNETIMIDIIWQSWFFSL